MQRAMNEPPPIPFTAALPPQYPQSPQYPPFLLLLLTTLTLLLLLLLLLLGTTTLQTHTHAYLTAPSDLPTYLTTIDLSIAENDLYDASISRLPRLEDKIRLSRLLREIQKCGDDLREELQRCLVDEGTGTNTGMRLKIGARLLWASRRVGLEAQVRRLDLLRMRFLVVYLGVVAEQQHHGLSGKDPEKQHQHEPPYHERHVSNGVPKTAVRPSMPHALTESLTKKPPPLRRITTQAMGHTTNVAFGGARTGWAGVVEELQRSPLMHKRHASIDAAMTRSAS